VDLWSDAYRDTPQFQFRESVKPGKRKLKKLGFRIYTEGDAKKAGVSERTR